MKIGGNRAERAEATQGKGLLNIIRLKIGLAQCAISSYPLSGSFPDARVPILTTCFSRFKHLPISFHFPRHPLAEGLDANGDGAITPQDAEWFAKLV